MDVGDLEEGKRRMDNHAESLGRGALKRRKTNENAIADTSSARQIAKGRVARTSRYSRLLKEVFFLSGSLSNSRGNFQR